MNLDYETNQDVQVELSIPNIDTATYKEVVSWWQSAFIEKNMIIEVSNNVYAHDYFEHPIFLAALIEFNIAFPHTLFQSNNLSEDLILKLIYPLYRSENTYFLEPKYINLVKADFSQGQITRAFDEIHLGVIGLHPEYLEEIKCFFDNEYNLEKFCEFVEKKYERLYKLISKKYSEIHRTSLEELTIHNPNYGIVHNITSHNFFLTLDRYRILGDAVMNQIKDVIENLKFKDLIEEGIFSVDMFRPILFMSQKVRSS